MTGTGKFIDEADLREKYKGKVEQFEAIKANARSFMHPTRNVMLYEDTEYSVTDSSTTKESEMDSAQIEFTMKGTKKGSQRWKRRSERSTRTNTSEEP